MIASLRCFDVPEVFRKGLGFWFGRHGIVDAQHLDVLKGV